jgi:dihydrofolate reductase
MRVIVINHVTLDGVMQGPGWAEEDTRDGFRHGGWAVGANDELMTRAMAPHMGGPKGGLLLGRRSYEGMLGAWNERGGPFKDALNAAPKFVASSRPDTELRWPNSRLLHGDVPAAVGELKAGRDGELVIMGSGELIRSLLPYGLIDEFLLMIHPLVLGSGRRLFAPDGHDLGLALTDCTPTPTGVIIASYRPA